MSRRSTTRPACATTPASSPPTTSRARRTRCGRSRSGIKKVYVLNDKQTYGFGVATTYQERGEEARHAGRRLQGLGREAVELRGARELDQGVRARQAVFLGGIVCNNGAKLMQDIKAGRTRRSSCRCRTASATRTRTAQSPTARTSASRVSRRARSRAPARRSSKSFGKQIGTDAEPVRRVRRTGDAA